MAEINSLTYFVYSLLTLAAHHEPADHSLKAWEVDTEPPVTFAWNEEPGNYAVTPVPEDTEWWRYYTLPPHWNFPYYAEDTTPYPYEMKQAEDTTILENSNSRGCPSSSACSRSCKSQGYKWGICTGENNQYCKCHRRMIHSVDSTVGPDDVDPYTRSPRDSEEMHQAERDQRISQKLSSGGCPSTSACNKSCQSRDYKWGMCNGNRNTDCICYGRRIHSVDSTVGPDEVDPYTRFPRVNSEETDQPEAESTIPEKLHSGGCPSSSACSRSCKSRGYKWGLCGGDRNKDCTCYSHMTHSVDSTVGPDEVDPYTRFPRANSEETDQPEPEPTIPGMLRGNYGCPSNSACTKHCQERYGKKLGSCTGFQRLECHCFDHW